MAPDRRKSTQRERLLAGMLAVADREGYAGANVSQVIAHAGVSRPTFYDYFTDKDDCFLALNRDISERLLLQIRDALDHAPPEQAAQAAVRRLIVRAEAEPVQARFLANVTMAGGPRAILQRDRTVREVEKLVDEARAATPVEVPSPDLPTKALIGATHWLIALRIHRGERDLTAVGDELVRWAEAFNRPTGEHRWRTLEPGPLPGPSPHVSELPLLPPTPIPSGRSRLSRNEIARNQRLRILFATAEVAAEKGYTATTVADITGAARVDKRVFYTHFRDKQQAFLAVHELAFQQLMAVSASAFFSADTWPERVWQAMHAACQFIATHPMPYVVYVESHAVGAPAIQRVEDSNAAFAIFLQEGIQQTANPQTRTALEAIIAAIFEIGSYQFRHRKSSELSRYSFLCAYIALAPFLGVDAASELLAEKQLEAAHRRRPRDGHGPREGHAPALV
jgi:AcrR family transcriptional regulator